LFKKGTPHLTASWERSTGKPQMTETPRSPPTRFRTGALSPRKPTRFDYSPEAAAREVLARDLGLLALGHLSLRGEITPLGRDELVLTARLEAAADQACVVTLAPVPARIGENISRRYIADLAQPEGDEVEMPDDDSLEPMPEVIDLAEIATEALALALPPYPRAPGAELGSVVHAGPGVTPMTDADLKPFAGLAALAEKLGGDKESDDDEGD
jgi:uncharacterized metal-binding protein YceD (DUF177 family)